MLVYVGAVSILFIFILMLINVRISELMSNTKNSLPLALFLGIFFNFSIDDLLPSNLETSKNGDNNLENPLDHLDLYNYKFNLKDVLILFTSDSNKNELVYVTSRNWDSNITEISHITSIGNIMYTSYSIWLIVTSLILLLAMVGTIVITVKQK